MSKMNEADFCAELTKLEDLLREHAGVECAKFYRPPEGRFSEANLKTAANMGYKTVFWSLAYADWDNNKQPDPEKAKQLLLSNTHNGAVILLHPTSKTNADILDSLLTEWEAQGYRFGTLDELF
jgi:peptidoglycan-N-acetylmuramic acid deacetylase